MADFIVTTLADDGAGSMRQAIADAAASGGADRITFDEGLRGGTIRLQSSLVVEAQELEIAGFGDVDLVDGVAISGLDIFDAASGTERSFGDTQILRVGFGARLTLRDLVLQDGRAAPQLGHAASTIDVAGTGSHLTLEDVVLQRGEARADRHAGAFADTAHAATVIVGEGAGATLKRVVFEDNVAEAGTNHHLSGTQANGAGAMLVFGEAELDDVVFSGATAEGGAGASSAFFSEQANGGAATGGVMDMDVASVIRATSLFLGAPSNLTPGAAGSWSVGLGTIPGSSGETLPILSWTAPGESTFGRAGTLGDDVMEGALLAGLDGDDLLTAAAEGGRLFGWRGDDRLLGRSAADRLFGEGGNDRLNGGGGDDQMWGGDGEDRLRGRRGDDMAKGGAGRDALNGGAGEDTLSGQAAADRLWGGAEDDAMFGGRGADLLHGGRGRDRMEGGAGRDDFVLRRGDERDVIVDFEPRRDDLRFESGARSFEELAIRQQGDHAVIVYGRRGDAVRLLDVEADALTARDFLFG